jgi:tetratricopeptide (TPR) repeat protein
LQTELAMQPDLSTLALLESNLIPIVTTTLSASTLIGRETQLAQLKTWLLGNERLVTVVGLGGSGKTRLALEAARQLKSEFVHGMIFIDGTALQNALQFPSALAKALGFKTESQRPLESSLSEFLSSKAILLLLDNFEHLLETRPFLQQLLTAPDLRILVTSRLRLAMQQETLLDLQGLPVPHSNSIPEIIQSEAVRLFTRVANRISRTQLEPLTIARIVRRLEGLPLAVELAARWTRVLSLSEIETELKRSQLWLETDVLDVPERHRSLQAVLHSTWVQLSKRQRIALEAISVFRGGASFAALQAVAQIQLPTLLALVNSSLLHRIDGRYTLHEMIREFAALQAPNFEKLQAAHWNFFYALLQHVPDTYRPAELPHQFKADLENLLAGWHWFIVHGAWEKMSTIIARWVFVFEVHGWRTQAQTALTAANDHLRQQDNPELHLILAQLLRAEAYFTYDPNAAKICIEESIAIYQRLGHTAGMIEGYLKLGELEQGLGNFNVALQIFEKAIGYVTEQHHEILERLDYSLNELHRCLGNYEQARFYANRYTQKAIETNFIDGIGRGHHALGLIAQAEYQYQNAEQHFLESLTHFRAIGFQDGSLSCLTNLGIAQMSQNRFADAKATVLETMRLKEELGRAVHVEHNILGQMLLEQNQPNLAFLESLLAVELATQNHAIIFALDALKTVSQALLKLEQPLGKDLLLQILNHPSTVAETRDAALKTWQSLEPELEPPNTKVRFIPELLFDLKQLALKTGN